MSETGSMKANNAGEGVWARYSVFKKLCNLCIIIFYSILLSKYNIIKLKHTKMFFKHKCVISQKVANCKSASWHLLSAISNKKY